MNLSGRASRVHDPEEESVAALTPRPVRGAMADWTCPDCGQSFTRRNQSHSCARQEAEELFEDYPAAVAVTRAVQRHLASLGPVEMAATKTQVSFRRRVRFAWVWVPRQAVGPGKPDEPVVSFALHRREAAGRVKESVQARGDLWTHHVVVPSARQVDARLKAWLGEAYETVGPGARA